MSSLRALLAAALLFAAVLLPMGSQAAPTAPAAPVLPYPILFVTQPPVRADFATIGSTFANHRGGMDEVARGGALWIRYPNGTLKNLTAAGGYGSSAPGGMQDADAIAVRDPSVHWNGQKALFSMVIGAPAAQYDYSGSYYWQIYEISGLASGRHPRDPQGRQPACQLQQHQPDLRRRRPYHLHQRPAAQWRTPPLSAARRVRNRSDRQRALAPRSRCGAPCTCSITLHPATLPR